MVGLDYLPRGNINIVASGLLKSCTPVDNPADPNPAMHPPAAPARQKILYIVTKSVWGGAQRYVFDLATRLPAGRLDISVACGPSTSSGQAGTLDEKLREAGVRVIPIPTLRRNINIWKELTSCWSLFQCYRRERPDIIHLSSSKAGGLGAVAAFLYKLTTHTWRTRVIFTVHGWPFGEDRPWWQRALIFLACWASAFLTDRIILIDTADYRLARRFIPEEKLTLIFHGIDPIPFLPRSDARAFFSERIGPITADTLLLGANAELTKNKGLDYLIDAIGQIKLKAKDLRLKTIVMGEGEERQHLQEKIHQCGLGDTIFLIGFVPDARKYLRALDLFVLPSIKEGLPYALIEAAAAGLPIVASRVGGIPDIIQNEKSGLIVPPRDPTTLAEAMQKLLTDRTRATRLGSHARDTAFRSFRIDAMIANTLSLYGAHF